MALPPVGHLVRRFARSLNRRPPSAADDRWAEAWLAAGPAALWASMPVADRRHSIEVARRFRQRRPEASHAEMAGALLHDVGKTVAGLGTAGRVLATVVGPRTPRLRRYHDHEAIGARLAATAGAHVVTVALIGGRGPAAADLQAADDSI